MPRKYGMRPVHTVRNADVILEWPLDTIVNSPGRNMVSHRVQVYV